MQPVGLQFWLGFCPAGSTLYSLAVQDYRALRALYGAQNHRFITS